MKRDMNLLRELLLKIEEKEPEEFLTDAGLDLPGRPAAAVQYHVGLLQDAGLIKTAGRADDMGRVVIERLTAAGHDFLDAARDQGRWKKALAAAATAKGVTIEVMKQLLTSLLKQQLGL